MSAVETVSPNPFRYSAKAWGSHAVMVFAGQHDTHIKSGEDYDTRTLASIFAMEPGDKPKGSGLAFIPSIYRNFDGREHKAQRERGGFVTLTGDIDHGNHNLDRVETLVRAFVGDCAWLIYSSAHAVPGDMRWRIVLPLDCPVAFDVWHDAQHAFFRFMEAAGVEMDRALDRAAQPVYLPNVPPGHGRTNALLRGDDGEPLHYRRSVSGEAALGLSLTTGPIAEGLAALAHRRADDERERERIRGEVDQRRASRPSDESGNIIADFNASNSVATMLELCGYEQSPRHPQDWRSPNQTGDTYATRIIDDKWVSLSASDTAAGVGELCKSGCFGDAYDLYVHYKHRGDHKSAFRQLHSERRGVLSNVVRGRFSSEPPPSEDGDPGYQEMPDWVASRSERPESITTAPGAGPLQPGAANTSKPLSVSATPYLWRDPTTLKPREWVYGRSIQRGHVRAILAPGAAGKTILSVGEALAMATGRNLLGQEVPGGPKRVWLWNLEDDGEELARIIQAACKHWSIGPEDLRDQLFVDSALEGAILKLATSTAAEGLVINRPLVAGLTDEMLARGIDYLHVDPFVSSHAANENDNMEIDAIAKEWALVAKNAKAGVGLAHHVSKVGAVEVTAMSGRGAVALINACRSVLVINRMGEDEAKAWGIEEERRRRFFRVYDDKNNRAPPSDKSDWYTMASVSLGNGQDPFDEGDNMGVVIPWSPPDAFEGVTVDHLLTIQQAVDRVADAKRYRADVQAVAWIGKVVADVFGLSPDASVKADRARINKLLGTWFATGALVRVEGKDAKYNDRTFVEVGTWAVQGEPPTSTGEVGSGGGNSRPATPHPTCPPIGAGVGESAPQVKKRGGGNAGEGRYVAGNPALGSVDRTPRDFSRFERRAQILAPGETGDEPVPGGFDE